ncbi:MoxR family ATPase [[Clostridium] spiroforme]|nr:MoxR family ATPase [Thomasclavelia spiroformis]MBM6879518.1 MoxR family ATPase [Thomasclavelia spiroformis]
MKQEINQAIQEIKKAVIGKDDVILKVFVTLLARGHILLEDIPGVGKTNLALALSKSLQLDYHRIQLTPDVMPSDIIGFTMYNPQTQSFEYKQGIAFCHLLLADEMNRTSSKTQSALLELMEEGQMTVDGQTYVLPQPFCVIATQNPFGSAGTQLLPDSQMDRFMSRLSLGYPQFDEEIEIMKRRKNANPLADIQAVLSPEMILQLQKAIDEVYVHDDIYHYIMEIVQATRNHEQIEQGASPRGSLSLMKTAKAYAFLNERDYVIPQDVQYVASMVLAHRLILTYEAKMNKISASQLINEIIETIGEPQFKI